MCFSRIGLCLVDSTQPVELSIAQAHLQRVLIISNKLLMELGNQQFL